MFKLNEYVPASNFFAVNWPGHSGLYLHNRYFETVYILDPNQQIKEESQYKYKILDVLRNV